MYSAACYDLKGERVNQAAVMDGNAKQNKKRRLNPSNSSDNSGDEGKKRGRPRVEKQDESAADVSE